MPDRKQTPGGAFSGRTRSRTPRKSVLIKDRIARWVISLGGVGSILAVSMVGLFLVSVAAPLFLPSTLAQERELAAVSTPAAVVHVGVSEFSTMAWMLHRDGSIDVRRLSDGRVIRQVELPDAGRLTARPPGSL